MIVPLEEGLGLSRRGLLRIPAALPGDPLKFAFHLMLDEALGRASVFAKVNELFFPVSKPSACNGISRSIGQPGSRCYFRLTRWRCHG